MRKSIFKITLVFFLFCILTAIFNFPIVKDINKNLLGPLIGDNMGSVWHNWWLRYAYENNLNPDKCSLIAAPFGINFSKGIGYFLWNHIIPFFSIHTNEVFTYNFLALISFPLAGFFMYLLVYHITKNDFISLIGGFFYTFSAYHFSHSWVQLCLAHIQWIPLFFLCLFRFKDRPDLKNAIFLGISFALIGMTEYCHTYIASVGFVLFLIYFFVARGGRLHLKIRILKNIVISILIMLLLFIPSSWSLWRVLISGEQAQVAYASIFVRPFKDLFFLSARPLSYALPTIHHPVFGKVTEFFMDSSLYGSNDIEHSLYLGWAAIIFALLALIERRKMEKKSQFAIGAFTTMGIGALIFSFPPYMDLILFKVYFPSFFMYKILPMFRAYTRFGVLVLLSTIVLASLGLDYIFKRITFKYKKGIFIWLIFLIASFELLNFPPYNYVDTTEVPQVYKYLKYKPKDIIIAEYPLRFEGDLWLGQYQFYQRIHQKPMIDGARKGTEAYQVMKDLIKLEDGYTIKKLMALGVDYIIIHEDKYMEASAEEVEVLGELPNLEKFENVTLVKDYGNERLYKIVHNQ